MAGQSSSNQSLGWLAGVAVVGLLVGTGRVAPDDLAALFSSDSQPEAIAAPAEPEPEPQPQPDTPAEDEAGGSGVAGLLSGLGLGGDKGVAVEAEEPAEAPPEHASLTAVEQDQLPTQGALPPVEITPLDDLSLTYAQLEALPVKGKAPKTGYDRDAFGQRWSDDVTVGGGNNGCDQRNDLLRTWMADVEIKENTNGCVVLRGTLNGPYSGEIIHYERGRNNGVDLDHAVSLGNAWITGAQFWDEDTRRNFANDPDNLVPVTASLNRQKRDGDTATWVPPTNRCEYIARQIYVKFKYNLWIAPPEKDAMLHHLRPCG